MDWSSLLGVTLSEFKQTIRKKHLRELLQLKSTYGTSALTVLDIEKNTYLYVDGDIEKVTGIAQEKYNQKGPQFVIQYVVLEHIPFLFSSTIHQRKFFSKLPKDAQNRYVYNREYAYKGSPRRRVLHQVHRYFLNPQGKPFAVAVMQTRIDKLKVDNRFRYYIFDKVLNQVIYPKESANPSKISGLTSREQVIFKMISEGYTSAQIAEKLSISFHTVRTHRKQIYKKMDCKNVLELAQKLGKI